jgi:hypothetical protein
MLQRQNTKRVIAKKMDIKANKLGPDDINNRLLPSSHSQSQSSDTIIDIHVGESDGSGIPGIQDNNVANNRSNEIVSMPIAAALATTTNTLTPSSTVTTIEI